MERVKMYLRITGCLLLLLCFILYLMGEETAAVSSLAVSLFCFAIVLGLQLSNFFHQRNAEDRRQ